MRLPTMALLRFGRDLLDPGASSTLSTPRRRKNQDGSFGPKRRAGAPASNWIQTVQGCDFFVALRLYGTAADFFGQTRKPDDVVKVT